MMRRLVLSSLMAAAAVLGGCGRTETPTSPEAEAQAAIKTRLGAGYDVHLMTTHQDAEGVAVCGYAGPNPMPPTDKPYPFPPGDKAFLFKNHKLSLSGDAADVDVSVDRACPGFPRPPVAPSIP